LRKVYPVLLMFTNLNYLDRFQNRNIFIKASLANMRAYLVLSGYLTKGTNLANKRRKEGIASASVLGQGQDRVCSKVLGKRN